MKLALCLFGEPRFIQNEIASTLYKEFITSKYDTDIYGHTWIANSYQPSSWSKHPTVPGAGDIKNRIEGQYPGIKLVTEESRVFDSEHRDRNNMISQIYSINVVADLLINPDQYKFILFGRYDLLLARFQPVDKLEEGYYGTDRHSSLADQLIFASPKYLPAFKMYESILKEEKLREPIFSIEQFKLNYFNNMFPGIAISKHDFLVSLIRNL
jgi:hypothetical protein